MESIFTVQTPSTQFNDGPYTLGTVFNSTADGYIFGIRWYTPQALPSGTPVGALYSLTDDTHGVLLAQVNLTGLVADAFNTVLFPAPVAISASPQLYVAAVLVADNYAATPLLFGAGPISNGQHLTAIENDAPPFAGIHNGRFHVGGSLTFPESFFGGAAYFVDVLFATTLPGGGHSHGHSRSRIPMLDLSPV